MRKHILSIVYASAICAFTMLMSACRTVREMASEEHSAQTTQRAMSSAEYAASYDRFFSALSAYADSIVVWMVPLPATGETGLAGTSSYTPEQVAEACPDSAGSPTASINSGSEAPRIGKIKISGLHLQSAASGEHATTHHSADSISQFSSRDSEKSESTKSAPKACGITNMFALIGVVCTCGAAVWIYLRAAHK